MSVQRARRLALIGFFVAFAAVLPAWLHSGTGRDSSAWLYLAFAVFGLGFIVTALGVAVGIAHELERRRKPPD